MKIELNWSLSQWVDVSGMGFSRDVVIAFLCWRVQKVKSVFSEICHHVMARWQHLLTRWKYTEATLLESNHLKWRSRCIVLISIQSDSFEKDVDVGGCLKIYGRIHVSTCVVPFSVGLLSAPAKGKTLSMVRLIEPSHNSVGRLSSDYGKKI